MSVYNAEDVDRYIKDVMCLTDRQRAALWYNITYASNTPDCPVELLCRFNDHCLWTKASILYNFSKILHELTTAEARRFAAEARKEEAENNE